MADEDPVSNVSSNNSANWNVDLEVSLFHAMHDHKPVGINRHFQMVFIHDKLNSSVSKKIPTSEIWKHLNELYDLQALHESECIPFPNKESDFILPGGTFDDLFKLDFPRCEPFANSDAAVKDTSTTVVKTEPVDSKSLGTTVKSSKGSVSTSDDGNSINDKSETTRTEDNVKSDRKRTRQSIQGVSASETTPLSTPASTKRVRRN